VTFVRVGHPASAWGQTMDYQSFFRRTLDELQAEGRYRVFADLERAVGNFPLARNHRDGKVEQVTVWCSND
jgi:5-aminolevulinate synthase